MRKFLTVCILIVFMFALSSCDANITPFKTQFFQSKQPREFSVYVCGAVKNEGYVHILEGTSYQNLISKAGYISQSVMSKTPYAVVGEDVSTVVVRYFDGQKQCDCINVNGTVVTDRLETENVSADVITKIADYIDAHGKISDKILLKQILGSDYPENFYKFFVSRADYEKID